MEYYYFYFSVPGTKLEPSSNKHQVYYSLLGKEKKTSYYINKENVPNTNKHSGLEYYYFYLELPREIGTIVKQTPRILFLITCAKSTNAVTH